MIVFRPFGCLIFIVFVANAIFARNDGGNTPTPQKAPHPRVRRTPAEVDFPPSGPGSKNAWNDLEKRPDFDEELIRTNQLVENIREFLRERDPEDGLLWALALRGAFHPPGKSSRTSGIFSKRFGADEEDEEGVSSKQDGNGRPVFNPTGW